MWGCSRRATVCASRMKRSATTRSAASSTFRTFTATSRFNTLSRARNTAAKPPCPSRVPTVNSWPNTFCRRCWRASRSMAVQQARIARRVLLVASVLFLVWLFGVWPPPIWWRDHQPRCTAMMRLRADVQSCRHVARQMHDGTSRRRHDDTHVLERMVIIAEDSRFKTHHGIDFIELRDAWTAGAHRGASTITQQLAKNLYLSPSRSIFRKLKEAVTALRLELALRKDRIMELYVNTAEWGAGVWGIETASRAYFGVAVSALSANQAAELAATLPQPRTSNPMFRPARTLARRDLILARYYGGKTPVPPALEDSIPEIPQIEPPILPPILDTLVVPDTLVIPDTTKDHPDSGGPVDSLPISAVRLLPRSARPRFSVYKP